MIKKFTTLLLRTFLTAAVAFLTVDVAAQCSTYTFELDPPPDNGTYEPGEAIEICVDVAFYQQTGANWIHGIIPTLPPGWDVTSFTAQSPPGSCSGSGTWIWLDSHFQNGQEWGPGFYYDAGNNGNVINWGDPCSFGDWEFCVTVTTDPDCGGPGNPLNGDDITPGFILTGDGETGSWITTPFTCNSVPIDASDDYPEIDFNCCDAEAGVSPGTIAICNNGPFDLIDELGAPIDLGGTWTGPPGWTPSANGTFNPLTDPPGDYTYTVTGTDNCENSSVITMEFIDLGIVQFPGYCNPTPTSLCGLVTNITCPPGGTWTDPNGNLVPGGTLDPATMPPGIYTYSFIDAGNCPTTFSIDVTLASGGGSAGITTITDICTSDGSFFLLDLLDGNPSGGGQWIHNYVGPPQTFVAFYPNSNVLIDPNNLADNSIFTYALGIPPCTPQFVDLTVNVFEPVDVGELTQTSICVTDPPVVLETLLNGTPDPGLTWTNTSTGAVVPGGVFDPSGVPVNTTITFVYSGGLDLTSCFATQILELTVLPDDAFAGNPNTITLCESDDFIFMTDFLLSDVTLGDPQPGGVWTNSAGQVVLGGFFVPGTTPPGTFTYNVSSSCGSDVTTLTVNVLTTPSPGLDGVLDICDNDVNIPLISGLNGTPAAGGQWSLSGVNVGNTVNGNAVVDGAIYTYTTGTAPCQETATVTISLQNAPFAGTATTVPQIYCNTDPAFSLFSLLSTPPSATNGTWTGPSGFSGPTLNPATATTGNYTYTLPNTGCGGDSETIFITIEAVPNAGVDAVVTVCPNATANVPLAPSLGGGVTPGGTWTGPSGPMSGVWNPGDPAGAYVYQVSSPSGLCVDQATVTVQLNVLPSPGIGGSVTVCETDAPFALISGLGGTPATSGFWLNPASGSVPGGSNAQFVPGTSAPGVYTYVIPVSGCPAVSSTVTVSVDNEPNAGTDTTVPVCESAGVVSLITYFPAPAPAPGGIWTNAANAVVPGGTFDVTGQGGTNQVFTYTVTNGSCTSSANITLAIENAPNAGPDVAADFCATGAPFNLLTILDPTADAGGAFTGGNNIVLDAAASGTYTYVVSGTTCPADDATYTLNVDPVISVNGVAATCQASQTSYIVTFSISGGDGAYTVDGVPTAGSFTSAPISAGTNYSFVIGDGGPCGDVTISGVSPVCTCPAAASIVTGDATICAGETVDLELDLAGSGPFTVVYSAGGIDQPALTGLFDGSTITVSPAVTTIYALVSVEDVNCVGAAAGQVTVTVETPPSAGPDVALDFCATGAPLNLITLLDPAADAGGSFIGGNNILLNAAASGTYTYEVQGNACPNDQATYTLNIDPVLATASQLATCDASQTTYTVSFDISGGDGIYSVDGTPTGATFTSGPIPVGTNYSFVVSDGGPCGDVIVSGNAPNCACPATASFVGGNQTICEGSIASLVLSLNGAGPFTVVYSAGGTDQPPLTGLNDGDIISVNPAVTTTYTLVSVEDQNCVGSASGSITVTVEGQTNAGPDISEDFCATNAPFNLLTILDPTADATGSFIGGNNIVLNAAASGTYTYEVQGNACPDDQAIYTINIDPVLTATGAQATCDASQANYTVTFTIAGGDGNYLVDGVPSGGTFTSAPLPVGTPYSFTVSDGGPCGDVVVSGNSPNCNCPATAAFSNGNETICAGSSIDLVLDLNGAGPFTIVYSAGGIDQPALTGLNDGDLIAVSPAVTTTYSLVSVEDINCVGSAAGSVTVTVETPPNAGPDVINDLCATSAPFNLISLLDPAAQTTGTFIGGNNIILNSAASGDYTYEVQGVECPADQAIYTLNIDPQITASGLSAVCNPAQTDYVVSFTIAGGDGNYTVAGPAGNLVGNVFTSSPIPNGDPYSFTVTDGGPCTDITVSGVSPDCNCTAQGSISGTSTICSGSSTALTFLLQGNGPFSVTYTNSNDPANPVTINNIFNGHTVNVSPTNNATYTLVSVSDVNCTGVVTGNPAVVSVNPPILVSNIQETCDPLGENYTVSFNISGGVTPYFVLPVGGTITAGVYTSAPIPSGQAYSFSVDDAGACPPVTVDGQGFECACISDAGTIPLTPIEVCTDESIQVSSNGDATLDANDGQQYILHNGTADSVGTVLATSLSGNFQFTGGLVAGQTYYVAFAVGNTIGGNVDLNHPCTSVTQGVSVTFRALPSATIAGGAQVCPGEAVDLSIQFTGEGPWDFTYINGGIESTSIFSASSSYTLTVTQPGTYTIAQISDNNCFGAGIGQANVTNFATPTATMGGNPEVCENSGNGPEIEFTGQGPWTFVYAIDGVPQAPVTANFANYTLPVETGGLYSLVSVEGPNCDGTVSGSLEVEIIPAPTATITGGGAICAGELADFNVNLTGSAPWNIQYTVDGVPQQPLNTSSPNYTFQSGIDGDYVIISVVDQNCQGEVVSNSASLSVTPLPTGEVTTSENILCFGQTLEIGFNLQGVGPFNIAYVINGDTLYSNGVGSNFTHTMQPNEPVIAELVFVEDGSPMGCSSEPNLSAFVQVSALPNAPVLTNDTICVGSGPVSIGTSSVPGMEYSWSPTNGLSDATVSNPTALLENTGLSPKTFAYVLTASNGECSASDTVLITVDPGPRALFSYSPDKISSEDPIVYFDNKTFGNPQNTYFWTFDSLGTSEAKNPVFRFPDNAIATYGVSLTVTDPNTGCMDDYFVTIPVEPEMLVFVPNAFTPDGDGLNELWGPVMRNIDEDVFVLTVYDRFGQIVFETKNPSQKWNGGMNGSDFYVQSGVYTWTINTKNKMTQDELEFTGHVTVLR